MTEQERPRTAGLTADEIEESIAPHGPKGECANPDLCVAASMLRLAAEDEGRQQAMREIRDRVAPLPCYRPGCNCDDGPIARHSLIRIFDEVERVAGLNASESPPTPRRVPLSDEARGRGVREQRGYFRRTVLHEPVGDASESGQPPEASDE